MDIRTLASGSSGNAYIVSDGKTTLLLDAGIPLWAIRTGSGFRLREMAGCLVTHSHGDHSRAAKDLAKFGVEIYASAETMDACQLSGHHVHAVKALAGLCIQTFQVLPFDVEHDAPGSLGYLIGSAATGEKLLYFTDTGYIKYRFRGLTHIIGECNYDRETLWENIENGDLSPERAKRLFSTHMSLDNLLGFLKANDISRVRQIHVCHLSRDNANEAKIKQAVQKLTGAEVYIC